MNYKKGTLILTFIGMVFSFSSCKNGQTIEDEGHALNAPNKTFNTGYSSLNENYVQSLRDFSADFSKYIYEAKNKICSPISIATCFSMLLDGCKNDSKTELEKLLHYDDSFSHLDEIRKMLLSTSVEALNKKDDSVDAFLNISQSFFVHNRYKKKVREEYINTLTDYYFAEAYQGDLESEEMHDLLAQWINEKTNDFFDLKGEDFKDFEGVLWLVNAIYTKAKWDIDFREYTGKETTFTNLNGKEVETNYISSFDESYVYRNKDYSIANIPLRHGLNFSILLPNDIKSCQDIFKSKESYQNLLYPHNDNMEEVPAFITYKIPVFKQVSDYDLAELLPAMGVNEIFDPTKADLSGISSTAKRDGLHVSKAIHSAGIDVSISGIEGAAYTIIGGKDGGISGPKESIEFLVDHPFLYALNYQNIPLFVGVQAYL